MINKNKLFLIAMAVGLLMPGLSLADLTMSTSTDSSATTTQSGLQFSSGLQMPADSGSGALTIPEALYLSGPRLIELDGTTDIYWVAPNNLKIPDFNTAIFDSYGSKLEDVQTVGQDEFDYYQNAQYIRLQGNAKIYKISGTTKRPIPSSVWNPAGINPEQIIDINRLNFNYYKTGKSVVDEEDLLAT